MPLLLILGSQSFRRQLAGSLHHDARRSQEHPVSHSATFRHGWPISQNSGAIALELEDMPPAPPGSPRLLSDPGKDCNSLPPAGQLYLQTLIGFFAAFSSMAAIRESASRGNSDCDDEIGADMLAIGLMKFPDAAKSETPWLNLYESACCL